MSTNPVKRWTREEILKLRPKPAEPKPEKQLQFMLEESKKSVRFAPETK